MTPSRRRWFRRLGIAAAVLLVLWLAASLLVAYRLTRRAGPLRVEPAPVVAWGTLEAARLKTRDGVELGAWVVDGPADRAPVLVLHGNGASRSAMLGVGEFLARQGHPLLLLTLRAHGDSEGQVNDFGRSSAADVIAAVHWMQQRWPGRKPMIYGESLGASAAMFASGELGDSAAGYVLVCPYTDLPTAVRNRTRMYLPAGVEWVAYAGLVTVAPLVLPGARDIAPGDRLARAPNSVPVLLVAGAEDQHTTVDQVNRIYRKVADHAQFRALPGKHLQLREAGKQGFEETVLQFMERHEGGR